MKLLPTAAGLATGRSRLAVELHRGEEGVAPVVAVAARALLVWPWWPWRPSPELTRKAMGSEWERKIVSQREWRASAERSLSSQNG